MRPQFVHEQAKFLERIPDLMDAFVLKLRRKRFFIKFNKKKFISTPNFNLTLLAYVQVLMFFLTINSFYAKNSN